jgi:hypothetical protein
MPYYRIEAPATKQWWIEADSPAEAFGKVIDAPYSQSEAGRGYIVLGDVSKYSVTMLDGPFDDYGKSVRKDGDCQSDCYMHVCATCGFKRKHTLAVIEGPCTHGEPQPVLVLSGRGRFIEFEVGT